MTSVMILISLLSIFQEQELPQSIGPFLHREKLVTNKLLTQEYCKPRLIKLIKKFYSRHHEIVHKFVVSVSKMILGVFDTQ